MLLHQAMRTKRKAILSTAALVLIAGLGWFALTRPGPLDRPVMDGKSISYWLPYLYGPGLKSTDYKDDEDRLLALGPAIVPLLLIALEDRPSLLRLKAEPFFQHHFPAVARTLWPRWPNERYSMECLAKLPPEPKIRDALVRTFQRAVQQAYLRGEQESGLNALYCLMRRHTNDPVVLQLVRDTLKQPPNSMKQLVVWYLEGFGTNALVMLPELIPCLSPTNSDNFACKAAEIVGSFGPRASNALPALRNLATSGGPRSRPMAALTVWQIDPESGLPLALSELILSARAPVGSVNVWASRNLGLMGPAASKALPALRSLLLATNKEPAIRRIAGVAIWQIAPESGFPEDLFMASIKQGEIKERISAARHLGSLVPGRYDELVIETLLLCMKPPWNPGGSAGAALRSAAAEALGELGARAERALSNLARFEADDDPDFDYAREAIKKAQKTIQKALNNSPKPATTRADAPK